MSVMMNSSCGEGGQPIYMSSMGAGRSSQDQTRDMQKVLM